MGGMWAEVTGVDEHTTSTRQAYDKHTGVTRPPLAWLWLYLATLCPPSPSRSPFSGSLCFVAEAAACVATTSLKHLLSAQDAMLGPWLPGKDLLEDELRTYCGARVCGTRGLSAGREDGRGGGGAQGGEGAAGRLESSLVCGSDGEGGCWGGMAEIIPAHPGAVVVRPCPPLCVSLPRHQRGAPARVCSQAAAAARSRTPGSAALRSPPASRDPARSCSPPPQPGAAAAAVVARKRCGRAHHTAGGACEHARRRAFACACGLLRFRAAGEGGRGGGGAGARARRHAPLAMPGRPRRPSAVRPPAGSGAPPPTLHGLPSARRPGPRAVGGAAVGAGEDGGRGDSSGPAGHARGVPWHAPATASPPSDRSPPPQPAPHACMACRSCSPRPARNGQPQPARPPPRRPGGTTGASSASPTRPPPPWPRSRGWRRWPRRARVAAAAANRPTR